MTADDRPEIAARFDDLAVWLGMPSGTTWTHVDGETTWLRIPAGMAGPMAAALIAGVDDREPCSPAARNSRA
jgi:hypothetical protein